MGRDFDPLETCGPCPGTLLVVSTGEVEARDLAERPGVHGNSPHNTLSGPKMSAVPREVDRLPQRTGTGRADAAPVLLRLPVWEMGSRERRDCTDVGLTSSCCKLRR